MPSRLRPLALHSSLACGLAAAALVFSASGAAADCSGGKPCVTKLVPVPKTPTFGGEFMLRVHWSSSCKYDKFHFSMGQEHSPTEVGKNRNQLCNQRSQTFLLTSAHRGRTIRVSVQGCESRLIGKDACTPFSPAVSVVLEKPPSPQRIAACRNYANRAVGAAKYARDHKCDPKLISGPRWSMSFDEHFNWCKTAEAKVANTEDRERNRISQECRIAAGMPQTGTTRLSVTSKGGDTFTLTVGGFAPNVPVIIDVAGTGAQPGSITVDMKGNRIVANASGAVTVTLFGAKVCKRGGGRIEFTARDQDGRKSNMAASTCAP